MAGIGLPPEVRFLLRVPLGFLCFSLSLFQRMEQSAAAHYGPETPPSLSSPAGVSPPSLPPSRAERSAARVNPGLSCPAVCIPSLLGEHGKAPGPLGSGGGEVKPQGSEREGRRASRVELLPNRLRVPRRSRVPVPETTEGEGKMRSSSLHIVANAESAVWA